MIALLRVNPLLLLFLVAAIGYPLGQIKFGGGRLGIAAVLFVGLAFGSLDPDLKLPEIIYLLGLAMFVYTIGLNSGLSFFASFKRKGLRDNLFVVGVLMFAALLTAVAAYLLQLKATLAVGIFAGSLTNTPALAAILDYIKVYAPPSALNLMLAEPVVGYSITYPMGVISTLLVIVLVQRWWKVDYAREAEQVYQTGTASDPFARLHNRTVRITQPEATTQSLNELSHNHGWTVVFGRLRHAGHLSLATGEMHLAVDDLITLVGQPAELGRATASLGELSDDPLENDRSELDYRRVFVSNPKIVGQPLRSLDLMQQFGAVITRLRRGDVELLPNDDTVLELGDRVRVLAHRSGLEAVSAFLGDSYRAASEIDILSFSFGLSLGLLMGSLPIPLPGGLSVKLGFAGGPLIVALCLGALRRTGPLVWQLPYSANLTLRQIGLVLFLAGVGTRAGYTFVTTLMQGGGPAIFLTGVVITSSLSLVTLWVGYRWLKIPLALLLGMLAGIQTQPAVLGFATEQTNNDLPNIGYASVYPMATICKILFAQMLLGLLAGRPLG